MFQRVEILEIVHIALVFYFSKLFLVLHVFYEWSIVEWNLRRLDLKV